MGQDFFQGKMCSRNIPGYGKGIETKFGTWIDFTFLDTLKLQWHFLLSRDVTLPENGKYLRNCQGFRRKHQTKQFSDVDISFLTLPACLE